MTDLLNTLPVYLTVFLSGILGGVHCLGMCGGIVSAISLRSSPAATPLHQVGILLGYNVGRILSYTIAGALAGGSGALLLSTLEPAVAQRILAAMQILSALLITALGLYLANLWRGVAVLEHIGKPIWQTIEPYSRRLLPVDSGWKALPFGMIWGWLPCGLVYTFLFMSLNSGQALSGALLMLTFGLGTLPNLLLMGWLSARLLNPLRQPQVRRIAGAITVLLGLLLLVRALSQLS